MDKTQDEQFEKIVHHFAEDVALLYTELDRQEVENAVREAIENLKSQVYDKRE